LFFQQTKESRINNTFFLSYIFIFPLPFLYLSGVEKFIRFE